MSYEVWQPGNIIVAPIYLDASFLAAALIRRDPRYRVASQLFGELLASNSKLVLSPLTLTETLWAIAKLSYCDLFNQKSSARFSPEIYRQHHSAIFAKYRERFRVIHEIVRDLRGAGAAIDVVPQGALAFEALAAQAPAHMEAYQLASADAAHLALAEDQAVSLLTTDTDFQRASASFVQIVLVAA